MDLLQRPVAFHRAFVNITGAALPALMLSQALYWWPKVEREGDWFYKTQAEWQEETGLTRWEQESARKRLLAVKSYKGEPIWEEKKKGLPAKLYYRVNVPALYDCIFYPVVDATDKDVVSPHPRMLENHIQGSGNTADKDEELPQTSPRSYRKQSIYTETTTETTNIGDGADAPVDADASPAPPTPLGGDTGEPPQPEAPPAKQKGNGEKTKQPKLSDSPLIQAYRTLHEEFPRASHIKMIVEMNPTLDNWVRAIRQWDDNGFNFRNIKGQLQWAMNPALIVDTNSSRTSGSKNSVYAKPEEVIHDDPEQVEEMRRWFEEAYPQKED